MLDELVGMKVDPEVARAVEAAGKTLAGMGHSVERASADMGGRDDAGRHLRHLLLRLRRAPRRLRQAQRPQGRPRHARAGDPARLRGGERDHAGALHGRHAAPPTWRAASSAQFYSQVRHLALADDLARVGALGHTTTCRKPGDGWDEHDRGAVHAALPVHHPAQHHGHAGHVAAAGDALERRADRRADRRQAGGRASAAAAGRRRSRQAMPWKDRVPPLHVSKV